MVLVTECEHTYPNQSAPLTNLCNHIHSETYAPLSGQPQCAASYGHQFKGTWMNHKDQTTNDFTTYENSSKARECSQSNSILSDPVQTELRSVQ